MFLQFVKFCPCARFEDVTDRISELRSVKNPGEISKIEAAVALNDRIWSEALAKFKTGQTEIEMKRVIQSLMYEYGEGEAFDTIVCIGKNAAECHHVCDNTLWTGREPVLVDMGVMLDGFCSDMTRNILPARTSRLYKKVYNLVKLAQEEAIKSIRPGVKAQSIDKIARDIIKDGGFEKCFGHGLGHGIGMEVHEAPRISAKSRTVLESGMVFSVEPGIYLEDNLGVRIEDLVLVTDFGCKVLTQSPKI
jgi:Xaa-Pro aminopeptidase